MLIWKQLLEQIVVQHNQYLAALHDPETSQNLTKEFNDQLFGEFTQLEQEFARIELKWNEKLWRERQELLDEGIDVDDLEF